MNEWGLQEVQDTPGNDRYRKGIEENKRKNTGSYIEKEDQDKIKRGKWEMVW